jgi:RNA polymerase sigma-70 factor (ECF subfamily)
VAARGFGLSLEQRLEVLKSTERLPDPYRTAIYLHYWHGSSLAEIADLLGARPNTGKTYLFRGRRRLEKALRGEVE